MLNVIFERCRNLINVYREGQIQDLTRGGGGGASIDSYRELAKATYRGVAPPFDACAPPFDSCAPSFDFCAPSFKCPLKSASSATLRKDGPSPSASFGPAPA